MLRVLLGFEARYQFKQLSFAFFSLLFFAYGVFITADAVGEGMDLLKVNSPYRLNFFIVITSISAILVSAVFCVNNVLRDKEYQFDSVVAYLAIEQRFLSRLFVAILSNLLIVSLISVGLFAGLLSPELDADKIGSIEFAHYFKPWLLFVLPNVFVYTVLLFSITYHWQRSLVTYFAAVTLFIVFLIFHLLIGAPITGGAVSAPPELLQWLAIIDPFGASAFFEQTQFWTPVQKNEITISFEGALLWNRLIWILVSILILYQLKKSLTKPSFLESSNQKTVSNRQSKISTFINRMVSSKPENKSVGDNLLQENSYHTSNSLVTKIDVSAGSSQHFFTSLLVITKFEINKMLSDWPFRILVFIFSLLVAVGIYMVAIGSSGGEISGRYPTTELLINQCTEMLLMFSLLMIVYFCAEKIWCEGLIKMSPLLDTTPVNNIAIAGGKLLSLIFIPLLLISVLIVMAMSYQLINGYYQLNLGHYLSMYYFFGLPILIKTIFIFFIQVLLTRSKFSNQYIAILISGFILILLANIQSFTGIEHPLLKLNHLPDMSRVYTESVGYGLYANQFNWYATLWGLLAISFLSVSLNKWSRGDWSEQLKSELSAKSTNSRRLTSIAIIFIGLSLSFAMVMVYQIHWKNNYQTSLELVNDKENYERQYRTYQNLIVPQVVDTKTTIDIFPQQHLVKVRGDYQLKNTNITAINTLFISTPYPLETITLNGAELTLTDEKWNIYIIELDKQLLPGQTLNMKYSLAMTSNPFAIDPSITANGIHLSQRQFTPALGYVWGNEIQDPFERKKRGLPEKSNDNFINALHGGDPMLASEKSHFETVISTSSDQIAVTSGVLVNKWQENERNFYHYKTHRKIFTPTLFYFSANYQMKKVKHQNINLETGLNKDTDIEMYYYPAHERNINEMIKAAKAALDYAETHFGEYIYPSLRILEVPGNIGKASAGVVSMGQNLYIRDSQDGADINSVARRTIHEVAHQWWGEKLNPTFTRGAGFFIESMAMYMQSAVLEEIYGSSMTQALARRNQKRYFLGRAYAGKNESSLSQSLFEQYLIYSKGATVLFAIKDLIGIEKFDRVFNQLIEQHGDSISVTMENFIEAINSGLTPKQKELIDDWLNKRIVYDLSVENGEIKQLENGFYSVEFEINATRTSTDDEGNQSTIDIDESIQIALFDDEPLNKNIKPIHLKPSYLKPIYINQDKTKVNITVKNKPRYLMIDPGFTRLDQNLLDNVIKLGEK